MKTNLMTLNDWRQANQRPRPCPTDNWYLDFAHRLLPRLEASPFIDDRAQAARAALMLACYLQDAIGQQGGWKAFADAYCALYGRPLPFYHCGADYVDDEINPEDVCLVLWRVKSVPEGKQAGSYTICDPFQPQLLGLAQEIYALMDEAFEQAPIAPLPSGSGWFLSPQQLQIVSSPLPGPASLARPDSDAARCLAHSSGHELLYFPTYGQLKRFFVDVLQWHDTPEATFADLSEADSFVVYANAKGMLLAPEVGFAFSDERNEAYNCERAQREAYRLFCEPGACPFDLLKYAMAHGLLPDAALPFANGRQLLLDNWDFLCRFYLGEYYEGD